MLKYRLALGPVLILLFVGLIWLDDVLRDEGKPPGLIFMPLMLLIGTIAARELTKIFRARQIRTTILINAVAVCAGLLASSFTPHELGSVPGAALVCSAGAGVMLLALMYYSRRHNTEGVVASTAATLLAFVYVGLLGGFLIVLLKEYSGWLLLAIVLVTKSYDIGAYFTGRFFGKHKLIPWLSPGKTWEGLFGGVVLASAIAAGATALFSGTEASALPVLPWWVGAVVGAVFGLVGQAGDLVASLLKRDAGLKDYSRALPGFGGVMDVADSPLLVAPVAYWLLRIISA